MIYPAKALLNFESLAKLRREAFDNRVEMVDELASPIPQVLQRSRACFDNDLRMQRAFDEQARLCKAAKKSAVLSLFSEKEKAFGF